MANLKYILREKSKREDGTCPIFLRITAHGRAAYLSTKIYITPEQWDKQKQRVNRKNAACGEYNQRLKDFMRKVEKFNEDEKTVRDIKITLRGNGGNDFVEYAEGVIESVRKRGQYWNAKNMNTALMKLIEFNKAGYIPFKSITTEYLRHFNDYLIDLGNKTNTRTKNLGSLKRIFSIAETEKKVKRDDNPFREIKLKKVRSDKQKLSIEEIQKIEELELPEQSLIWHVRNYFLFSFYTGGTRFIDLCYLKWENISDGRMIYKMSKTSAPSNVKLLPPAIQILEYYEPSEPDRERFVFPLLPQGIEEAEIDRQKKSISSVNALVNKYLKKIRDRAGVDTHISFHIARHSFADYWRRAGGSLYSLSKMLRHSSLSITEQYLKSFDVETVDEEMSIVMSKLKSSKDKTLKLVQ
jgi:integrase/recombinase XerD